MFLDEAYAMAAPPAGGESGSGGSLVSMLLPLVLMFVIFYFLLIRPQQKKAKEHQAMLNAIQKGDEVITSGGIYGTVAGITDNVVTLEIANNVKIKVAKNQISSTTKRNELPK
ncbi:MAG: preprotein translocase subunit YajC [Deltaproteobacteria bacterium]|nr:preprotein translocase subunit YajC [Deltaproteobacteria bacterium]